MGQNFLKFHQNEKEQQFDTPDRFLEDLEFLSLLLYPYLLERYKLLIRTLQTFSMRSS
jgi:hypothetical protein